MRASDVWFMLWVGMRDRGAVDRVGICKRGACPRVASRSNAAAVLAATLLGASSGWAQAVYPAAQPSYPPVSTPQPTPSPYPPYTQYTPAPAPVTTPPASSLPAWPPAVLPYRDGQPIPKAYRLESRANSGLIIGGTVTFLASYGSALGFGASHGFDNGLSWTFLPVVGPYGAIGARSFNCTQTDPRSNKCLHRAVDEVKAVTFLAIDGMVQAVGVALFFVGIGDRTKELVRVDMPVASLTPVVWGGVSDSWGLGLTGAF